MSGVLCVEGTREMVERAQFLTLNLALVDSTALSLPVRATQFSTG